MIIVLDNIRSAQNVGSILRTCDALGLKEVYLCGMTPTAENPKVKKTSLGAEKNVQITASSSTMETVSDLKAKGYVILSLEIVKNAININEAIIGEKTVLVIGNEVSGISTDVLGISDQVIMIPMQGIKESLNVSVAFGIAAYTLGHKKDL